MQKKRVLFVCLGNICRSPMAEFIFRKAAEREGLADMFETASAGTSAEEEGNSVYAGQDRYESGPAVLFQILRRDLRLIWVEALSYIAG